MSAKLSSMGLIYCWVKEGQQHGETGFCIEFIHSRCSNYCYLAFYEAHWGWGIFHTVPVYSQYMSNLVSIDCWDNYSSLATDWNYCVNQMWFRGHLVHIFEWGEGESRQKKGARERERERVRRLKSSTLCFGVGDAADTLRELWKPKLGNVPRCPRPAGLIHGVASTLRRVKEHHLIWAEQQSLMRRRGINYGQWISKNHWA